MDENIDLTISTDLVVNEAEAVDFEQFINEIATILAYSDDDVIFTVETNNDAIVEQDESFELDIINFDISAGYTDNNSVSFIGGSSALTAIGIIEDNDNAIITISDAQAVEAEFGLIQFTVNLSNPIDQDIKVIATADLGTGAGFANSSDINPVVASGDRVEWDANDFGDRTVTFDIRHNGIVEGTEVFDVIIDQLTVLNDSYDVELFDGANTASAISATGTIEDDDVAILKLQSTVDVTEGTANVSVLLSSGMEIDKDISVEVMAIGIEASATTDYDAAGISPATITAGSTSSNVSIDIDDDSIVEGTETFTVDISSIADLTLGGYNILQGYPYK